MFSSEAELHVLYQIGNARVREFPYPHIYVADIFPADFYRELLRNLPPQEALKNLGDLGRVLKGNVYPERGVLPLAAPDLAALDAPAREFWQKLGGWMLGGGLRSVAVAKFAPYLEHRFGDMRNMGFKDEALIVRDRTRYSLGPHTDSPSKVLSFLFYLPADAARSHLGTSVYVPRQAGFTCAGGPHYDYAGFRRMLTMPYVPNSLFAFMKTGNSFHGVEPIEEPDVRRDLLLYDVRVAQPQTQKPAPLAGASIKFTM